MPLRRGSACLRHKQLVDHTPEFAAHSQPSIPPWPCKLQRSASSCLTMAGQTCAEVRWLFSHKLLYGGVPSWLTQLVSCQLPMVVFLPTSGPHGPLSGLETSSLCIPRGNCAFPQQMFIGSWPATSMHLMEVTTDRPAGALGKNSTRSPRQRCPHWLHNS